MKKLALLILPVFLFAFTLTDLKPVDTTDAITFTIKNFGIPTKGNFKGLQGNIKWDKDNPGTAAFDVTIDAKTINTGIDNRDEHLRKEDYFNVEKFPLIRFKSTAVTATNITGNLTIKGISKTISFPYTAVASGKGYLFQGSFSISRKDFGIGGTTLTLSDEAIITLKVQAN